MPQNPALALVSGGPGRNAADEERRAGLRVCPEREFTIRLLARPNFHHLTAIVGDVCTSGLGLIMNQDLAAETVLCIQFPGQRSASCHRSCRPV